MNEIIIYDENMGISELFPKFLHGLIFIFAPVGIQTSELPPLLSSSYLLSSFSLWL